MTQKLSLITLSTVCCITFYSCGSSNEKKIETVAPPVASTPALEQKAVSPELAALEEKFNKDTTNYEVRAMLASNYYSSGALEKSAYQFLKVYEHDNKNIVALSSLGNIYYDSHQDDKAIGFYEKALEIDGKNINMRCDLATCYSNINKLKKAIQLLKENIQMDANHAQSHYNLSVILQKKGDVKEAAEEMKTYETLKSSIKK